MDEATVDAILECKRKNEHRHNGAPFASCGLAGLTPLSVWFIRLGIHPERIRPGKPQDNGRHERMHRTLKESTAKPPRASLRAQQRAFDAFIEHYNFERPHQALGQQTPSDFYHRSPRPFPHRLADQPDYPREWTVRKIKHKGGLMWRGKQPSTSEIESVRVRCSVLGDLNYTRQKGEANLVRPGTKVKK